jgi:hypothetical protein
MVVVVGTLTILLVGIVVNALKGDRVSRAASVSES